MLLSYPNWKREHVEGVLSAGSSPVGSTKSWAGDGNRNTSLTQNQRPVGSKPTPPTKRGADVMQIGKAPVLKIPGFCRFNSDRPHQNYDG